MQQSTETTGQPFQSPTDTTAENTQRVSSTLSNPENPYSSEEQYQELSLGLAQCLADGGNLNAGTAIERLDIDTKGFEKILAEVTAHPLIQEAFTELLQYFEPTPPSDLELVGDTLPAMEKLLAEELSQICETDAATMLQWITKTGRTKNGTEDPDRTAQRVQTHREAIKQFKEKTLSFHGWAHTLNTAVVQLGIAVKEKLVPENQLTELGVAMVITALFHDIGIAINRSYVNHELVSSHALLRFINKISNDQKFKNLLTPELQKQLQTGCVALFGTAVDFGAEGVRIGAALKFEEFTSKVEQNSTEAAFAAVPSQWQSTVSHKEYVATLEAVLAESSTGGLVDNWRKSLSVADVSGMLTPTCILGTFYLSLEEQNLANRPLGALRAGPLILQSLEKYLHQPESHNIQHLVDQKNLDRNTAIFKAVAIRFSRKVESCLAGDTDPAKRRDCELNAVPLVRKLFLYYMKLDDPYSTSS